MTEPCVGQWERVGSIERSACIIMVERRNKRSQRPARPADSAYCHTMKARRKIMPKEGNPPPGDPPPGDPRPTSGSGQVSVRLT